MSEGGWPESVALDLGDEARLDESTGNSSMRPGQHQGIGMVRAGLTGLVYLEVNDWQGLISPLYQDTSLGLEAARRAQNVPQRAQPLPAGGTAGLLLRLLGVQDKGTMRATRAGRRAREVPEVAAQDQKLVPKYTQWVPSAGSLSGLAVQNLSKFLNCTRLLTQQFNF